MTYAPRKEYGPSLYDHKSILYVFKQVGLAAGACKEVRSSETSSTCSTPGPIVRLGIVWTQDAY